MLLPNIRACTRTNTLRTRDGGGGDPSPLSRVPSGGLSPPPHPTLPPQRGTGASSSPQLRHLPLGGSPQLRVPGERDSQKVSQPSSERAGKSGRGRRKLARPTPPREEMRESQTQPRGSVTTPKSLLSLRRPGSQAPFPALRARGPWAGASPAPGRRGDYPPAPPPAPADGGGVGSRTE